MSFFHVTQHLGILSYSPLEITKWGGSLFPTPKDDFRMLANSGNTQRSLLILLTSVFCSLVLSFQDWGMFSKILRGQHHSPLCISLNILLALKDFLELKMATHLYPVQDVDSVILYKGQDYAVCNALFKKIKHLASDFDYKSFTHFLADSDDSRSYSSQILTARNDHNILVYFSSSGSITHLHSHVRDSYWFSSSARHSPARK